MRYRQYLAEQDITYEQYCLGIDHAFGVNEGVLDSISLIISNTFKEVKSDFEKIVEEFGIGFSELTKALKDRNFYGMMKSVAFNFKAIMKSIHALTGAIHKGLFNVFKELHKTQVFQKMHSGAVKVDEILERYPLLKTIGGPVVAGLLFYIWLNMTFIGHLDYDFDFSDMSKALAGNYSIADIFMSPQGLMLSTLFMTGSIISAPWLGKTAYNFLLGVTFTLMKNVSGMDLKILSNMRKSVSIGI